MSNSRRLRSKVELALDEYAAPGRVLLEHPDAARLCPEFLSTLVYVPWTGVPLMQAALARARA